MRLGRAQRDITNLDIASLDNLLYGSYAKPKRLLGRAGETLHDRLVSMPLWAYIVIGIAATGIVVVTGLLAFYAFKARQRSQQRLSSRQAMHSAQTTGLGTSDQTSASLLGKHVRLSSPQPSNNEPWSPNLMDRSFERDKSTKEEVIKKEEGKRLWFRRKDRQANSDTSFVTPAALAWLPTLGASNAPGRKMSDIQERADFSKINSPDRPKFQSDSRYSRSPSMRKPAPHLSPEFETARLSQIHDQGTTSTYQNPREYQQEAQEHLRPALHARQGSKVSMVSTVSPSPSGSVFVMPDLQADEEALTQVNPGRVKSSGSDVNPFDIPKLAHVASPLKAYYAPPRRAPNPPQPSFQSSYDAWQRPDARSPESQRSLRQGQSPHNAGNGIIQIIETPTKSNRTTQILGQSPVHPNWSNVSQDQPELEQSSPALSQDSPFSHSTPNKPPRSQFRPGHARRAKPIDGSPKPSNFFSYENQENVDHNINPGKPLNQAIHHSNSLESVGTYSSPHTDVYRLYSPQRDSLASRYSQTTNQLG